MSNITLKIDDNLLKKGKLIAVENNKSLSQWMSELLRQEITRNESYQRAKKQALKALSNGLELGGNKFNRDELYDRQ